MLDPIVIGFGFVFDSERKHSDELSKILLNKAKPESPLKKNVRVMLAIVLVLLLRTWGVVCG